LHKLKVLNVSHLLLVLAGPSQRGAVGPGVQGPGYFRGPLKLICNFLNIDSNTHFISHNI